MPHRYPPEFKVVIPTDLIAQQPAVERDGSRLLVYSRSRREVIHIGFFKDVVDFVAGDVIVVNDTKVLPARVEGRRPGGGRVDLLFLVGEEGNSNRSDHVKALIKPSRRLRSDMSISLPQGIDFQLIERDPSGRWTGKLSGLEPDQAVESWLEMAGQPPLPPYIRRNPEPHDQDRYQTVYAQHPGSLAAPTAGFHFTEGLIDILKSRGSEVVEVTLDIGLGTFQPIYDPDLSLHNMHAERYNIPQESSDLINGAIDTDRPITAVGTTVVRTLESAVGEDSGVKPGRRMSELFIFPPYRFKIVDRLITNFHRPDSTLLQLVAAFIGWDGMNRTYKAALDEEFRFYSYGDSMLIV